MNPFANHMSHRADQAWFCAWIAAFIISGVSLVWFGWNHTTDASASSLPACKNNAVIVRHNTYPSCDLSSGGILIELGTTKAECLDAGGRFLVHSTRRLCVGEDI